MSTYEAWRITYKSSEAAARAAYNTVEKLHAELVELKEQMQAIGAGGVEPLRKRAAQAAVPDGWRDKLEQALCDLQTSPYPSTAVAVRRIEKLLASAPAHPAERATAQAVKLLAADHSGMKVDYRGLFYQVQRALKRTDPGHAEMLRQLEGHLQELGQRWYAGDTAVVDELLQLYSVECQARDALAAQAEQEQST